MKLFRVTTVPQSIEWYLKGQLHFLNQYYEVTAIASAGEKEIWERITEREKVTCKIIAMEREISPFKDLISLIKLYGFFKKEQPYIVHVHTPKASLLSMLAAKGAKVPHRLYTVTGLRFETGTGIKRKVLILMEKLACWAATKVIPEGEGVKNTLIRNNITKKDLKIIGNGNINGIDTRYFSPVHFSPGEKASLRYKLNILSESLVFCFVGRLVKDKGINELVRAFVEINRLRPRTKLLLIGPFERELDPLLPETEIEIQNNANIISTGFQSDVRPYLAISDIFVLPSYREGFPNVVMQAGAMEVPAIVTDINGCNEIITDGVNGLIIPPKDKRALQEKMGLLLNDSDLRMRLKSNARRMITSRYEQRWIWEALLEEYQQLERITQRD
jgi:glycosyltransferase involved in cell wall biosynthesis